MFSKNPYSVTNSLQVLMKKTVVGFLSRPHGFNVLSKLVELDKFEIKKIFTHKLNPKSQDPTRSERSDFQLFEKLCKDNNIPLDTIDSKNEISEDIPYCDYIIEVSWRYLIPQEITKKAKIAAFGIHRGKLPDYAGAEPIKQALLKNEKEVILSAHYLATEIDKGNTITTISHPIHYETNSSLEENIQRLLGDITPLFSKLVIQTIEILEKNYQK